MPLPFADRADAGRRLARRLERWTGRDVVILAIPRGGVPVAFEVAAALGAPLDVVFVRKLGVPSQPELAVGAVGEHGVRVLNETVLRATGMSVEDVAAIERRERAVLDRGSAALRHHHPRVPIEGRGVVIVDDGIATGSTARAACRLARAAGATTVIVAAPVGPVDLAAAAVTDADEVVVLERPQPFLAVGRYYRDFTQTTDAEVLRLLERAAAPRA